MGHQMTSGDIGAGFMSWVVNDLRTLANFNRAENIVQSNIMTTKAQQRVSGFQLWGSGPANWTCVGHAGQGPSPVLIRPGGATDSHWCMGREGRSCCAVSCRPGRLAKSALFLWEIPHAAALARCNPISSRAGRHPSPQGVLTRPW